MTKLRQSKFTIIIANEHHFCEKSYKKVIKLQQKSFCRSDKC